MATLTQSQINVLNALKAQSASFNASLSSNTLTSVNVGTKFYTDMTNGVKEWCVVFVQHARPELGFKWTDPQTVLSQSLAEKAGFHVDVIPMIGSAFLIPANTPGAGSIGHTGIVTGVDLQRVVAADGSVSYKYLIDYRDANAYGKSATVLDDGVIRDHPDVQKSFPDSGWKFIWGTNTDYTNDRNAIMGKINNLFNNGLLVHSYAVGSQGDIDSINKLVNRFFLANSADKHNNLINLVELYDTENASPVNVNTLANGEWTNDVLAGAKVGTGASESFTGGVGNDVIMGGAGNDSIDGGDGSDVLRGGIGNDVLNGGRGNFNDTIDGGLGSDTVSFLNVTNGVTVDLLSGSATGAGTDKLISIENVRGTDYADTLRGDNAANLLDGRIGNDYLDGRDGNDTLQGAAGNDTVLGGAGNDKLYGGFEDGTADSGQDSLNGGIGNDTLNGGYGKDILTGGTGQDIFVFNTALGTTNNNVDRITDFNPADDTIYLDNSVFTKLVDGALSASMFRSGVGAKALDSNDYLLYNSQTGALSYDADGNGAGAAVQIAQLGTNLALTSTDFFVI